MHPISAHQIRKSSFSVFLAMCLLLSTVLANTAAPGRANAEGPDPAQRVPVNPYPSPAVDSALAKHDLTAAPSPLDNPLKGFAPFYPWDNETSLPHSLEWFYVPLKAVMNGPNSFTFDSGIEPQAECDCRQRQSGGASRLSGVPRRGRRDPAVHA
ncbi:hypothetical protein [Cohnella rhizosphaerae]|uniref:Uncharacterized protein n=1 Tax=Cohnella rhizosphaerae TaxID=1457232 RepID=A0A9X4KZS4_9BACL|nr:hypothetical protein [Cohnella rhizosphaerae]MDG0813932.1 hypothetical protein [Cohnella rhizosphaerae]